MKAGLPYKIEVQNGKLTTRLAKRLAEMTRFPTVRYYAWLVIKLLEHTEDNNPLFYF